MCETERQFRKLYLGINPRSSKCIENPYCINECNFVHELRAKSVEIDYYETTNVFVVDYVSEDPYPEYEDLKIEICRLFKHIIRELKNSSFMLYIHIHDRSCYYYHDDKFIIHKQED